MGKEPAWKRFENYEGPTHQEEVEAWLKHHAERGLLNPPVQGSNGTHLKRSRKAKHAHSRVGSVRIK